MHLRIPLFVQLYWNVSEFLLVEAARQKSLKRWAQTDLVGSEKSEVRLYFFIKVGAPSVSGTTRSRNCCKLPFLSTSMMTHTLRSQPNEHKEISSNLTRDRLIEHQMFAIKLIWKKQNTLVKSRIKSCRPTTIRNDCELYLETWRSFAEVLPAGFIAELMQCRSAQS